MATCWLLQDRGGVLLCDALFMTVPRPGQADAHEALVVHRATAGRDAPPKHQDPRPAPADAHDVLSMCLANTGQHGRFLRLAFDYRGPDERMLMMLERWS